MEIAHLWKDVQSEIKFCVNFYFHKFIVTQNITVDKAWFVQNANIAYKFKKIAEKFAICNKKALRIEGQFALLDFVENHNSSVRC